MAKKGAKKKNKPVECPRCRYSWTPRVKRPKMCPRCHAHLDWGRWKQ